MPFLRRYGAPVLGVAVSGTLLALAARNVDLGGLAAALSGVRLRWLVAMGAVIGCDLLVRALRWRLLLYGAAPGAGTWPLVRLEAAGLAVNNVLFLRLGELLRALLAARELGIPVFASLASVFVERMLDMAALSLIFGLAALSHPALIPPVLGFSALASAGGLVTALALLCRARGSLQDGWPARLFSSRPRLLEALRQAASGARALDSWPRALAAAGLSAFLWLLDAGLYWSGGRAMGLAETLGYGRSVLVLSTAAASNFLPAVPGSFGAFEQAVKLLLVSWGVEATAALGYAGFVHVFNYLLVTGAGIAFLYRAGYDLAGLKALGRSMAP